MRKILQRMSIINMMIGNLIWEGIPLFLAPMEDVTYKSFRWMCKKYGADVMYTEFISSEALVRDVKKTKEKMVLYDFDRPVAIQIYGHNISSMVQAAQVAEELQPDFIDINFGCPMKKIIRHGAGAGLLLDLPKMQQMASEIVKAVHVPVTAKTRLGWSKNDQPVLEVAQRLQDAGIAALAIHGRTREQLYNGKADWSLIGQVKNHPEIKIPIIGNGDVTSPEICKERFDTYGVDAVMIGRGSIGRPWIFKEVKHYMQTNELLEAAPFEWYLDVLKKQVMQSIERLDEHRGILHIRRHLAATPLFKGIADFKSTRIAMLRAETVGELFGILDEIPEKFGICSKNV